jgi:hypothetical protein
MTRTFVHHFDPPGESPISAPEAQLTVSQIEHAGLKEVLQSAGAKVSSWAILDSLLEPNVDPFRFIEPLGIAREVKVAASGLFGRFVARAYLEKYMGLAIFAHIGSKPLTLDGQNEIEVKRIIGQSGDLPDWIACSSSFAQLTVAEAKGCHNKGGPASTLRRAWNQVRRVNVYASGLRLPVKRIAVVTRWASTTGGSTSPIISVRDPEEEGDPLVKHQLDEACMGLARMHVANLLGPLGYGNLATSLRHLAGRNTHNMRKSEEDIEASARTALEHIRPRKISGDNDGILADIELIGSLVTRAGPIPGRDISKSTARDLRELHLRPVFVGIERSLIKAIISGNTNQLREAMQRTSPRDGEVSADPSGTWVLELGGAVEVS